MYLKNFVMFNSDGLVPVITQEFGTNEILMMAFANAEALDYTEKTGKATYFSRSRNKLWCKGEESGNFQEIKEIRIDCDSDTILYIVEQKGLKASCHTGHKSCFFRTYSAGELTENDPTLYFNPDDIYKTKK